jgi:phosphohistidine phosphatase
VGEVFLPERIEDDMKLYLVQHGEALDKKRDPQRPLSVSGHEDVANIAAFLTGRVEISRVVHSGKIRARETAEVLGKFLAQGVEINELAGLNPLDSVTAFAEQIIESKLDTLVVGHLPFMAELVSILISGSEEKDLVAFLPGTLVCLACDENGEWQIEWMIRPGLLR